MTRRHPRDAHTSNPHGTAPPTRHAHQQSAWHSATHATHTPAIRMAQRHPRDTHASNPHGTAPAQRPVRPAHQAVKSSTQRESSPKRPHRPAPARTTHPPYARPPATKSHSAIRFFLHPQLLQLPNSYSSATLATRTPAHSPTDQRSVTPEASHRNFLRSSNMIKYDQIS